MAQTQQAAPQTQQVQSTQKPKSIANFLNFPATQKFLEDNLQEKRGEFVSNLIALVESDTNLQGCDHKQLMMCAMNATALNLPLNKNLGFAYVIPYKGVPSFQIGYKGLIQLAIRTGAYEYLNATEIREGEVTRNKITGEITFHGERPNAPIIGYLAYLKLQTGFTASLYMSEAQIEEHAVRFSKMYAADRRNGTLISKWSDPLARPKMAIKTVLKGLLGTYGVITTEMARALEVDDTDEKGTARRDIEEAEVIPQTEPVQQGEPQPTQQGETRKVEI